MSNKDKTHPQAEKPQTEKTQHDAEKPSTEKPHEHKASEIHATIKFDNTGTPHDKNTGQFVSNEHVNRSLSHEKPHKPDNVPKK